MLSTFYSKLRSIMFIALYRFGKLAFYNWAAYYWYISSALQTFHTLFSLFLAALAENLIKVLMTYYIFQKFLELITLSYKFLGIINVLPLDVTSRVYTPLKHSLKHKNKVSFKTKRLSGPIINMPSADSFNCWWHIFNLSRRTRKIPVLSPNFGLEYRQMDRNIVENCDESSVRMENGPIKCI